MHFLFSFILLFFMILKSSKSNNKRRVSTRRGRHSANPKNLNDSKKYSSPFGDLSWLLWATLSLFLLLSLISWSPQDGGWFQISSREEPINLLGRVGASLSDFMIFCFGLSSFWWVVLFGYITALSFKKNFTITKDKKDYRGKIRVHHNQIKCITNESAMGRIDSDRYHNDILKFFAFFCLRV